MQLIEQAVHVIHPGLCGLQVADADFGIGFIKRQLHVSLRPHERGAHIVREVRQLMLEFAALAHAIQLVGLHCIELAVDGLGQLD